MVHNTVYMFKIFATSISLFLLNFSSVTGSETEGVVIKQNLQQIYKKYGETRLELELRYPVNFFLI